MIWILSYPGISLCYGFLYLSVVLLWYPGKRKTPNWATSLFLALCFGLISGQLEWSALIPIVLFAVAAFYSQAKKTDPDQRFIATVGVLFLSLGLISHQLPGFNALMVLDHVYFTTDALPYNLYLNIDKALVGIFILGFGPALLSNRKQALLLAKKIWQPILIFILLMMILAFILNFIRFEPKLSSNILIWVLTNLLLTCVAEEALFRGFIQKKLTQQFKLQKVKGGAAAALIIASVLFGLAHYSGGKKYVFLAMMAGLGYGWLYQQTKRIEASIAMHFGLNLVHFIFFTYPALASVY
ncbi:MAG TPA: CPBP family intramembrane glutamic endopeptidase [Gammaproteobacteria bacterium]|nr:CPBP family intramembrane glutamic endopeptidase [Gammaproteobacteria bacterium]